MDTMQHLTTASPMARLARALATPVREDWTIEGPLDGKLVTMRHRDDVAIKIDRGTRKHRACRMFVEVEVLHSGAILGSFRQTAPEVIRTWAPFGYLPLVPRLPKERDGMRDVIVQALDHAVGAAASRRLAAIRARLAIDVAPFRDGRPDPQGIGWHLAMDTGEIYGPRQTLTIAETPALEALRTAAKGLCVLRHGKMEPIPHIHIPELDSAHARAAAAAAAAEAGLAEPLYLTSA